MSNVFTPHPPPPRKRCYKGCLLGHIKLSTRLLIAITENKYIDYILHKSLFIFCLFIISFLYFVASVVEHLVSKIVFALQEQTSKDLVALISVDRIVFCFNQVKNKRTYTGLADF